MFVSPSTMRAVQGKDYGDIDETIHVDDSVQYPSLEDIPIKQRKNFIIIQTHAVALACGDVRVLSGLTRELQGPPSFPYIPGGDCCGTVVEIPVEAQESRFKVGDRVAARFGHGPRDALAEFAVINTAVCAKVPEGISSEEAAALAGACPAILLAERIQRGERILIFGAGGGLGSHVCQIVRSRGASFIAGVSSATDRLLESPLSYDRAIDYTKDDPFSIKEFQNNPFDVILDLSGGCWMNLLQKGAENNYNPDMAIIKPASHGGRYLTTTPDNPIFELHTIPTAIHLFLLVPVWRSIKSRLWARSRLPAYSYAMSLPSESTHLTRIMDLADEGTLQAVIDEKGPFPFSTEGVRNAFHLQESRHPHGKVIVQVKQV
mmetsp:Transcript_22157/g.27185  ORF Transcript_22157/g.27185 Transcript_22157/m.27185 type:complete len:376 (-) Transcript_22157:681-1808(-)